MQFYDNCYLFILEPYDYPAWCLILVFSVHSIGASIFIFEWLSPAGLDQGKTPLRGNYEVNLWYNIDIYRLCFITMAY